MERTLEPEQYVLVDKLTPRVDAFDRGDIVVFNPPAAWAQADGTPFIKRVIGEGGDTIKIQDGKVFVNGRPSTRTTSTPTSRAGRRRRPSRRRTRTAGSSPTASCS